MWLPQYSHDFVASVAEVNYLPYHHVLSLQALVLANISEKKAALTTSADIPIAQPWLVC